jgi:hypothetical protein
MAGFVEGGAERARRSAEYAAAAAIVRAEVEAEYEPLLAQAGFFAKLRLRRQCRRRIAREIEDLAPGRAFYW